MEVLITDFTGLPNDAVLSMRCGNYRRQAPLDAVATHPLKFPSSLDSVCEPVKIDILQPIATTRLVLFPHGEHYQIGFEDSEDVEIGCDIKPSNGADRKDASSRPGSAMPVKIQDAAASSKQYLEDHGLLKYVQSMLHAVIQMKPVDPYAFMIAQLSTAKSRSKVVRSRPTSAIPGGRCRVPPPPSTQPPSAVAGRKPVPPSTPPPSGERPRPPGRSLGQDDSQVVRERPLEKPAPPQAQNQRHREVPEQSDHGPHVSSEPPVNNAAPPQQETFKSHEEPKPSTEFQRETERPHEEANPSTDEDAQQRLDLDKPVPPQQETLRPDKVPEPNTSPPSLPEPVEEERVTQAVDEEVPASGGELEELKLRMRKLVEDTASSGQLEEAIKKIVHKDVSAQEQPTNAPEPTQAPKLMLPSCLFDAKKAPELTHADKDLHAIKEKMQDLLTHANEFSKLEEVIGQSRNQRPDEDNTDLHAIKAKLQDLFTNANANESGKLEEVIGRICNQRAPEAAESDRVDEAPQEADGKQAGQPSAAEHGLGGELDVEQIKSKIRSQLQDQLRERLRGLLTEAFLKGKLAEVFGKASPELAGDRVVGGRRDAAELHETPEALATGEAPSEAELIEVKVKLRRMIQEAQGSGKLAEALVAITATKAAAPSHIDAIQE